jgi:hypothetical protein
MSGGLRVFVPVPNAGGQVKREAARIFALIPAHSESPLGTACQIHLDF